MSRHHDNGGLGIIRLASGALFFVRNARLFIILAILLAILVLPLDIILGGPFNFLLGGLEFIIRGLAWAFLSLVAFLLSVLGGFLNGLLVLVINFVITIGNLLIGIINGVITALVGVINSVVVVIQLSFNVALCGILGDPFACAADPANLGPIQINPVGVPFVLTTFGPITNVFDISAGLIDVDAIVNSIVLPRLMLGPESILSIIISLL